MQSTDRPSGSTVLSMALAAALLAGGLAACSDDDTPPTETDAQQADKAPATRDGPAVTAVQPRQPPQVPITQATADSRLEKVLVGPQRTAAERARDQFRHPMETLQFFGIDRGKNIIEIDPGAGWYSAILSPMVKSMGSYYAAVVDDTLPGVPAYVAKDNAALKQRFASDRSSYDATRPLLRKYNPDQPVFGRPGSADMVLSFRNAHNWIAEGNAPAYFKGFFDVLESGGTLGIVDHRANPGPATDGVLGYVTEQQIIELASAAGFRMVGKSEINANPKDTKDYPDGVWTLPPSYALKDKDRAKYAAIGESDRMTLKFVKP